MLLAVAEVVQTVQKVPTDSLTHLSVGGLFAIMIIREFVAYTKGKKAINGFQKAATCTEIVKRFDKNFESQDKRFDKIDTQLEEVKNLILRKQ